MKRLPNDLVTVLSRYLSDIATPRALAVKLMIEAGDLTGIAQLPLDPDSYVSADRYYRDACATSILKKLKLDSPALEQAAVEAFYSIESVNYRTNQRLRSLYTCGLPDASERRLREFIALVRKNVESLIGSAPPSFVEGRFGPGATFGDRGAWTTVPDKMRSVPTLTCGALGYTFEWAETAWARACASRGSGLSFVHGNRFATVPKDLRKRRAICIEPSLNLFYQLGLGRVIRNRLLQRGVDLDLLPDFHRRVARESSVSREFCTIDLSNASDTLCYELVKLVVPSRWFASLDALRSPATHVDGKWVHLEKFSSMGNGFTFELESVIFLAISMAVMESQGIEALPGVNVSSFGDDIIVPNELFGSMSAVLSYLGFSVNKEKSFHSGVFRESCGGDFFAGQAVRPYFLKELPCEPQHWIAFANGLFEVARDVPPSSWSKHFAFRAWLRCLGNLPSTVAGCIGPRELGDIVIHDHQQRWSYRWRNSIREFRCYRPVQRTIGWEHWDPDVVLASALYGRWASGRQKRSLGVVPRNGTTGYRLGWVSWS